MFNDLEKKTKSRTCITFDSDLLIKLNVMVAKKEIKSLSAYLESLAKKDLAKKEKTNIKKNQKEDIDDLGDL